MTLRILHIWLFLLASLAVPGGASLVFAQPPAPPDTLHPQILNVGAEGLTDTLRTDTLRRDTTFAAPKGEDGVDTVVHYVADNIDFDVIKKITILTGNAIITYKDMRLEAGKITVDWNAQQLLASPLPDTTFTDSTQAEVDTIQLVGRPHFMQGTDDFFGDQIAYNMKSKVGRVLGGTTEYEQGHYYGEQFKRIAKDVIIAKHGAFTTCDRPEPHYHFAANQLKINVGKRVIARPVVLYFADVPVMAAPYGIFPQQKGRTSGILIPIFGESSTQGRFLRDIGYYWAPSDYLDLMGSIDYYEQFGVLGRSRFRYAKRYVLDGHTNFAFDAQRVGGSRRQNYAVESTHNQQIDRSTRLALDARYMSDRSFADQYGDAQDLLNQQLRSSLTLNKAWENSPWTSNLSANYTQHLTKKTWQATLPSFLLNHKSGNLFPAPKAPRGVRGAVAPKELEPPWYRAFTWNYRADYLNTMEYPRTIRQTGYYLPPPDSLGRFPKPVPLYGDTVRFAQSDGLSHNGGISATAKILRYLNLNPRINAKSAWTRRATDYAVRGDTLLRKDQPGFFTRTTFDVGTSATTKLYGTARKPFGIGASFRHVVTPSTGFTYRPDFGDEKWGYMKTVHLPNGREYQFDRFSNNASNIGGTPVGLSEVFNFGLDQLYQMKLEGKGEEAPEEGQRFDLLSWSMGTAVDIKRDSLRWNNIGSTFRTSLPGTMLGPVQGVGIDVSLTHSLYRAIDGRRIREFYFEKSPWYAPVDLINSSINLSFAINSERIGDLFGARAGEPSGQQPFDTTAAEVNEDTLTTPMGSATVPPRLPSETRQEPGGGYRVSELFDMPLSLRISLRQSRDYVSDTKTSTLAADLPFSLTTRWDIQFSYAMDLERKQVTNSFVTVTRDLHCWEASLQWSPIGYRPGYYLRIGLRSPQLRDVKIERRRGAGIGRLY